MIDHSELTRLLDYDQNTGQFTWKVKTCRKVVPGKKAGGLNSNGYVQIKINNIFFYGHRLAWFYVHSKWPEQEIDHINGNPSDNRMCNLRAADRTQNNQNRIARVDCNSGVRGVMQRKDTKKWRAEIRVNKKLISLGCFQTLEEAASARKVAEQTYFTHHRETKNDYA
jgi:hypothetical protein